MFVIVVTVMIVIACCSLREWKCLSLFCCPTKHNKRAAHYMESEMRSACSQQLWLINKGTSNNSSVGKKAGKQYNKQVQNASSAI